MLNYQRVYRFVLFLVKHCLWFIVSIRNHVCCYILPWIFRSTAWMKSTNSSTSVSNAQRGLWVGWYLFPLRVSTSTNRPVSRRRLLRLLVGLSPEVEEGIRICGCLGRDLPSRIYVYIYIHIHIYIYTYINTYTYIYIHTYEYNHH